MKKYKNARNILPAELVEEIQKYIQGEYLYIPNPNRQQWGQLSGIREELKARNKEIYLKYIEGVPVQTFAEIYSLSQERIRGIIYEKQSE